MKKDTKGLFIFSSNKIVLELTNFLKTRKLDPQKRILFDYELSFKNSQKHFLTKMKCLKKSLKINNS